MKKSVQQILSALIMVKGMEEADAIKLLTENFEVFKAACPYLNTRDRCQVTGLSCSCANCPFLN